MPETEAVVFLVTQGKACSAYGSPSSTYRSPGWDPVCAMVAQEWAHPGLRQVNTQRITRNICIERKNTRPFVKEVVCSDGGSLLLFCSCCCCLLLLFLSTCICRPRLKWQEERRICWHCSCTAVETVNPLVLMKPQKPSLNQRDMLHASLRTISDNNNQ